MGSRHPVTIPVSPGEAPSDQHGRVALWLILLHCGRVEKLQGQDVLNYGPTDRAMSVSAAMSSMFPGVADAVESEIAHPQPPQFLPLPPAI